MRHKTGLLGLSAMLCFSTVADSAYIFTNLPVLATRSDLIIKGAVVELKGDFFAFEVQHVLRGSLPGDGAPVLVARFKDWPCAHRWAPYAPGQQLILFLERLGSSQPALWLIIGAGGDGEVVIENQTAHFHTPEGVRTHCFDLTGGRFCGDAAPLAEFLAGVVEYGGLYRWRSDSQSISQAGTDAEVEAFAAQSPFRRKLVDLTRHPERAWSKK